MHVFSTSSGYALALVPGLPRLGLAATDTHTAAKPTADQMRVLKMLEQLAGAADWRGVAAQERAARAVAAAVRTTMPGIASFVYCTLGSTYACTCMYVYMYMRMYTRTHM
jgi:hypothetical protein